MYSSIVFVWWWQLLVQWIHVLGGTGGGQRTTGLGSSLRSSAATSTATEIQHRRGFLELNMENWKRGPSPLGIQKAAVDSGFVDGPGRIATNDEVYALTCHADPVQ